MVKPTTRADPRKPGRPKKGEVVEDRVDMKVKVNPEFKRLFDRTIKQMGLDGTYEKRKALDDRLAVLEAAQNRVADNASADHQLSLAANAGGFVHRQMATMNAGRSSAINTLRTGY